MATVLTDDDIAMAREANFVVALTGAGVSAESGIPTFRDRETGLWAKYDPVQLATPEAFERDPELVTRWYDSRRILCAAAKPNAAHLALARWERELEKRGHILLLVTQNIDRLHHAAGSRNVIELHGTLWVWRCATCGEEREERGGAFESFPPRCACGGMRRPGVVWFGESLSVDAIRRIEKALKACDLFLSIGTSGVVYPAAGFLRTAKDECARAIEINREPTPLSRHADRSWIGNAGEILTELVERAFPATVG